MFYTDSGHYVLPFVLNGDNIDPDKEDQELRQAVSAHVQRLIHSNKVTTDTTVVFHSTSEAGSGSASQDPGLTNKGLPSKEKPPSTHTRVPTCALQNTRAHVLERDGLPSQNTRNYSL